MTQHAPARAAFVRIPAASLPEVDSVSPQAPIFSPRASGTEKRLLLLFVAEIENVRGAETVVRGHRQRDGRIDARQFLDADAVVDRGHRRAAVLLGKLDAEQADRRELRHQLGRKVLILIPLPDVRADFGFRELAHGPAQQRLLFRRPEVHKPSNCSTKMPTVRRQPQVTPTGG